MKKIGLLLACTIVLSGCSPTNGILKEKDVNVQTHKSVEMLIKEQEKISYLPEDVKLFLQELKEVEKNLESKDGYNYLRMVIEDINRFEGGKFVYETGVGIYSDDYTKKEFEYLVDALDKTIAKGIKLYIDKNGDVELGDDTKATKIGRVWINIMTEEVDPNVDPNYIASGGGLSKLKPSKNNISLSIQIRDVKNEQYKKLVNSLIEDNLTLYSIKDGKEKDLITLNNIEFKNGIRSQTQNPAINYELFVEEDEIDKVRISIISAKGKIVTDQDLKLLEKLSSEFDFKNDDIKVLEDIRKNIKSNKNGKFEKSSDRFSFKYSTIEDKSYEFTRNMKEIVIEKKK